MERIKISDTLIAFTYNGKPVYLSRHAIDCIAQNPKNNEETIIFSGSEEFFVSESVEDVRIKIDNHVRMEWREEA